MVRENQKYFNRLQVLIDAFAIVVSFLLAFYIRFYTDIFSEGIISVYLNEAMVPIMACVPLYLTLYNFMELYSPRRTKSIYDELKNIIKANTVGFLGLIMILFGFKLINFSRYVLLIFYFLNIGITAGSRISIRLFLRKYRKQGMNLKHCLLVGYTEIGIDFLKKVRDNPHWGYHMVGVLDRQETQGEIHYGTEILDTTDHLAQVLEEIYLDMVILAIDGKDYDKLGTLISICEKAGVKTHVIPFYYRYIPAKPYMDDLDGLPIIDTRHVPLENVLKGIGKRTFDILFSLLVIVLLSPIFIVAGILTKVTSPGPMIYKQERVGLNRKNFMMYKFRSMKVQDEGEEQSKWTTKTDPRKTRWGSFMRKTSLDELPQFFNVLMGDMSIVGPRPERPYFVERFKEEIPKYMIKHQVRPGITGWAQVNGWRGDTSIVRRIECDLYYIENWTFSFDLKIIFMTVFKGLINKNAY